MPPTSKEVGFTLSRSSAATRYSASERSIRDALPPYWLLGLETVAVSKRLLGIRPQHRQACGYLPERERQQDQRQQGCVDPARSRLNALGSEGWVLNLKRKYEQVFTPSTFFNRLRDGPRRVRCPPVVR